MARFQFFLHRYSQHTNTYVCFVNYDKAYDRIHWSRLLHTRTLRRVVIDWRNRRLIGKLHMGQKTQVRISGEYSESGNVDKGVIQGCPLSPLFSNIYIEEIVRSSTSSTIPVQSNQIGRASC